MAGRSMVGSVRMGKAARAAAGASAREELVAAREERLLIGLEYAADGGPRRARAVEQDLCRLARGQLVLAQVARGVEHERAPVVDDCADRRALLVGQSEIGEEGLAARLELGQLL